jgi:hypothetical protein
MILAINDLVARASDVQRSNDNALSNGRRQVSVPAFFIDQVPS